VVFQGHNVRDEEGYAAVFSEQGTSASHIAAAKWLDAISRMPGNNGEDSDAMGAYTQAEFQGEETWVSMPRERWPKAWIGKYHNPVVRLRLNLYGHPLAGLYWEKHCRSAILKCGFRPVTGWECLYENPTEQLYLSVYVDDSKMAGNAASLTKMWAKLGKYLDLEPPIPLEQNVYLGCGQKNIPLPRKNYTRSSLQTKSETKRQRKKKRISAKRYPQRRTSFELPAAPEGTLARPPARLEVTLALSLTRKIKPVRPPLQATKYKQRRIITT
jgi:hypothetical protein